MSLKKVNVTPQRVASMALHMSVERIAERLELGIDDVEAMLAHSSGCARQNWAAVCLKTGRKVTAYSERGAYLKAQIHGFAEWRFEKNGSAL